MPRRGPTPPPSARLAEFFRRLSARPACDSHAAAYGALVATLEEVEDELTDIENQPEKWQTDGRLYPPEADHWFAVPGRSSVVRMRTKGHNIFISANGAIEIQTVRGGQVVFFKVGADGREVWDDE